MILLFILLFVAGVCMSALFSGSETGFYCVSRVRLVLDGLDGDRSSRRLLWVANNPSIFVATALIGNNFANNLITISAVLIVQAFFSQPNVWIEIGTTVMLTPFLFVYGESLPKTLFLKAPNRLLRMFGWLFGLFGLLFSPLTALLWALSRGLERLLGKSPETVRLALARNELADVLVEGHEIGILDPAQHELSQSLFDVANQTVRRIFVPTKNVRTISLSDDVDDVIRQARRWSMPILPVRGDKGALIGYVQAVDMYLRTERSIGKPRPLISVHIDDMLLGVLMKMQTEGEPIALVLNESDRPIGIVFEEQLTQILGVDFGNRRTRAT
jgi:putative hemolysin